MSEPNQPVRATLVEPAADSHASTTSSPAAPPAEPPEPRQIHITRSEGRVHIDLIDQLEELLAFPGGVAWTQSGQVWAVLDSRDAPTLVAELTDPHGLTADEGTLYWVGHTENGRWDAATGELTPWPVFAGPSEQANLSFGDALYGQDRMGVWRFAGHEARRLPLQIRQGWRVLGFRAGRSTVVLGVVAMERQPGGIAVHKQYVRALGSGKPTIIPTRSKPSRERWDVNAAGDLAFIRDSAGVVAVLKAKRKKPKVALTEPGITTLCFCGPALCTVAEGVLHRHAESAVEHVADVGEVGVLSCTAESVAWSALVDGRIRISVQALAGVGSSPSTTPM